MLLQNQNTTIQILPDFIANQIAAGEVVQRPESVVKELVENSLDAGAKSIVVVVRNAGKQLIHIVDNGKGMSPEDLVLATKRHATSKIMTADDLEEIRTYGFRGEALASIASVANIEIRTKRNLEEHGWKLIAEPMKEDKTEPCNTDNGTQIFVRNLFYNVPARRKFLRSNLSEFRYISDTMMKFALSKPNIQFTFYDDENLIFNLTPAPLERRIAELFGEKTIGSLIPISHELETLKVYGFIGLPELSKQSRAGQYLFLNGRSIQSKSLSYAVYSAYEHLLEKKSQPFFLLNLEINPKSFDVNVHPQKHEVKFEDERIIFNLINHAVTKALSEHNLAPSINFQASSAQSPFARIETNTGADSDLLIVNKLTGEIINSSLSNINSGDARHTSRDFRPRSTLDFERSSQDFVENRSKDDMISAFDALFKGNKDKELVENKEPIEDKIKINSVGFSGKIWQLHQKYLFIQTEKGLMIIDQHAAHERILYERAIKAMNKEYSYMQDLLFPVRNQLNPSEITIAKELENELKQLGFTFTYIGTNEIELLSVPLDIKTGEESRSFKEIIEQYDEEQKIRTGEKRDNLAASFACKAAIKTGEPLSQEEIRKLIDDLYKCSMPYSCPHGRPVIIELSLIELDKWFGRV